MAKKPKTKQLPVLDMTGLIINSAGKVGRHEGFTETRARTRDHDDVVFGLHHGEMQAGTQTAQRLHRQIGRITGGQQGFIE